MLLYVRWRGGGGGGVRIIHFVAHFGLVERQIGRFSMMPTAKNIVSVN